MNNITLESIKVCKNCGRDSEDNVLKDQKVKYLLTEKGLQEAIKNGSIIRCRFCKAIKNR